MEGDRGVEESERERCERTGEGKGTEGAKKEEVGK